MKNFKNFIIMEETLIITVKAPTDCTKEQFIEWIEFNLGRIPCIKKDNPLCGYSFEVERLTPINF